MPTMLESLTEQIKRQPVKVSALKMSTALKTCTASKMLKVLKRSTRQFVPFPTKAVAFVGEDHALFGESLEGSLFRNTLSIKKDAERCLSWLDLGCFLCDCDRGLLGPAPKTLKEALR